MSDTIEQDELEIIELFQGQTAVDRVRALLASHARYKAALKDEIKFLETCFDTWMDREHLETHIARMCAALTAGETERAT